MRWLWHGTSGLAKLTLLVGALCMGVFAYRTAHGTGPGTARESFIPADVRSSPGGYRSVHYWHARSGGYRGGK